MFMAAAAAAAAAAAFTGELDEDRGTEDAPPPRGCCEVVCFA